MRIGARIVFPQAEEAEVTELAACGRPCDREIVGGKTTLLRDNEECRQRGGSRRIFRRMSESTEMAEDTEIAAGSRCGADARAIAGLRSS